MEHVKEIMNSRSRNRDADVAAIIREIRSVTRWPRALSVELAAEYLSVSEQTVRSLVRSGRIPVMRHITEGRVLIDRIELEKFIEQRDIQ